MSVLPMPQPLAGSACGNWDSKSLAGVSRGSAKSIPGPVDSLSGNMEFQFTTASPECQTMQNGLTSYSDHLPANHSQTLENKEATTIRARCEGNLSRLLDESSPIGLLSKMLLDYGGWRPKKNFALTWKVSGTSRSRLKFRLVPSAVGAKGRGLSLLPTPMAEDYRDRGDISNPCIQRRMRIGKQVGLSMLFKGTPCPFCVASILGIGHGYVSRLITHSETELTRGSQPSSVEQSNP